MEASFSFKPFFCINERFSCRDANVGRDRGCEVRRDVTITGPREVGVKRGGGGPDWSMYVVLCDVHSEARWGMWGKFEEVDLGTGEPHEARPNMAGDSSALTETNAWAHTTKISRRCIKEPALDHNHPLVDNDAGTYDGT